MSGSDRIKQDQIFNFQTCNKNLQNNCKIKENNDIIKYGNTGFRVFKGEIQNQNFFWLKINGSQIRLLNFENWSSGELSKIGHHFRKYSGFKIDVIKKNVNNKRYAPKLQ